MKNKRRGKVIKFIILGMGAMAVIAIAIRALWWYGLFLPGWISWEKAQESFGDATVTLQGRCLKVRMGGENGQVVWETQSDWFVQDVVVKDIDRDGEEELILLVWKHGSYGNHMPFWVEKNDEALKQHIYIYKYEETRESKIRAIWMSSQIEYEITDISSGEKSFLNVTDRSGNTRIWTWRDFGLKLVR